MSCARALRTRSDVVRAPTNYDLMRPGRDETRAARDETGRHRAPSLRPVRQTWWRARTGPVRAAGIPRDGSRFAESVRTRGGGGRGGVRVRKSFPVRSTGVRTERFGPTASGRLDNRFPSRRLKPFCFVDFSRRVGDRRFLSVSR